MAAGEPLVRLDRVSHHLGHGAMARQVLFDVIEADREIGDDLDLRGQPLEDVSGEVLGVTRQDPLDPTGMANQFVRRIKAIVGIEPGLVIALQALFDPGRQLTGDQNDWFDAHVGFS